MDFFDKMGFLALASRLKRLTDRLYKDGENVYKELNINFKPKWFTILYFINHSKYFSNH